MQISVITIANDPGLARAQRASDSFLIVATSNAARMLFIGRAESIDLGRLIFLLKLTTLLRCRCHLGKLFCMKASESRHFVTQHQRFIGSRSRLEFLRLYSILFLFLLLLFLLKGTFKFVKILAHLPNLSFIP